MSLPQEQDKDRDDFSQLEPEESEPVQQRVSNHRIAPSNSGPRSPANTTTENGSLVPELSDEDLWMLIRRFNKQICCVRATPDAPPQELDLNRAEDEQFPAEKLRITIERFYASVIVGVVGFWSHITRLRSWKDPTRTSVFCATYFVAWSLDLLVPAILGVLVALIWCPRLRPLLFPPDATVRVDSDAANAKQQQQATAGESASGDSVTGAPEAHKGEAAEQEATQLVNTLAGVAIEGAAGKYGQRLAAEDDAPTESSGPNKSDIATTIVDAQPECPPADSKAKQPMKRKMSRVTDQTMRVLSDVTDIYEKFSNSLSPTPPFDIATPRLRLVGLLTCIGVVSLTPSYWMIKIGAFVIGFGLFGDPVIRRTVEILDQKVPDWSKHMDMQKTLLQGTPTNAQLTLTLLRIGEMNSFPLPPPPNSQEDESSWPIYREKFRTMTKNSNNISNNGHDDQAALPRVDDQETKDRSNSNPTETEAAPPPTSAAKPKKRRWVVKVLSFVRHTIAAAIKGHATLDRAIAIAGSTHTKTLRGMLQNQNLLQIWYLTQGGSSSLGMTPAMQSFPGSALKFDAKFERKRGALVVDDSKDPPVLYFTTYQSSGLADLRLESRKKSSVLFQLPVTEVRELEKTQGLGWKGKLIVELTAGSKEAAEGLVISGSGPEQCYQLTGMRERNQLFNRLVAMGGQFWESC